MKFSMNIFSKGLQVLKLFAMISFLCCFIPLFGESSYDPTDPINSTLDSEFFTLSLIVCIALNVPIILDFILNSLVSSYNEAFRRGWSLRAILLFALFYPNFVIFLTPIPYKNSLMIICIIRGRGTLLMFAVMGHIWEFGAPVFRCRLLILAAIVSMTAYPILMIEFLFSEESKITHRTHLALLIIPMCILIILGFRWFKVIYKKSFKNISLSEYICNVYLLFFIIAYIGIIFAALSSSTYLGRNVSADMMAKGNFILGAFTVVIFIVQGRIISAVTTLEHHSLDMKRMFVRYVSHEIRTPLNTVFLGLDVLKSELNGTERDDHMRNTIEELKISCNIALDILNELLDYEKLDAGLLVLEKSIISAASFLDRAIRPFYIQARQADINLQQVNFLATVGDDVYIKIDERKLSQVLRNFISNALKFSVKGGTVVISAHVEEESVLGQTSRHMLVLEVKDTGAGILKENLPKVFNEIIQFSPGQLQNGGGSGLGLWISKKIVNLHDGQVSVTSEGLGLGCTLSFRIPTCPSPEPELSVPPMTVRIKPTDTSARHRVRLEEDGSHTVDRSSLSANLETKHPYILVVDDSLPTRKMMCRGLKCRGYEYIDEAENGVEALTKVKSLLADGESYDIVLMDYQMPVMDGPTATKHMRDEGYKGYVLGITGNALQVDTQYFIEHGANYVITKPIAMERLESLLKEMFDT